MNKIYITSDLHLGHDKDFVVAERGFNTVCEHDAAIKNNWNGLIDEEDEIYLLGDVMLGDVENGLNILSSLKGKIHIIRGNHDTDEKIKRYRECSNVVEVIDAKFMRYVTITLYLSHFPTLVSHEKLKKMKNAVVNLYGHTHQKNNFYTLNDEAHPYMYHVGLDSHNMMPVLLDDVIEEVRHEKNNYDGLHKDE